MAELRTENAKMRQDIIDLQDELKVQTIDLEAKTKEVEELLD